MMKKARWLVVIWRETYAEVTPFEEEDLARAFFDQASLQWSESYLARVVTPPERAVEHPPGGGMYEGQTRGVAAREPLG